MEVGWSGVVLHTPSLDEVEEFYRSVLGIPTRRVGGGLEAGWGRPLILVREGEGRLPAAIYTTWPSGCPQKLSARL